MSFGEGERKRIRENAGYYCQICGTWHPPHKGKEPELDAHSLDRTHKDQGMALCTVRKRGSCHQKLHDITNDPTELSKLSREAAQMGSLGLTYVLLEKGIPENRIRRILDRVSI